jgi:hypothetical protein
MPAGLAPDSPVLAPSEAESPGLGIGAVGCAAEGFELAAGSAGFGADGAGCAFCVVLGSAGGGAVWAMAIALVMASADAAIRACNFMKQFLLGLFSLGIPWRKHARPQVPFLTLTATNGAAPMAQYEPRPIGYSAA